MKKNRPGVLLTVLCRAEKLDNVEHTILQHSTTLGLRKWQVARTTLPRETRQVTTPLGQVSGVVAQRPGNVLSFAPEYEDCRRLARATGKSLVEIYRVAQQSFNPETDIPQSPSD